MNNARYDRQIAFFGTDGQKKLTETTVAIIGIGGLGTHVIQQLAYLGIKNFILIDDEEIDETNLNRYVGAKPDDKGKQKTAVGKRIIKEILPDANIETIPHPLQTQKTFDALISADCIFGCLDNEGARVLLNKLCCAYERPYFDLGTEIYPEDQNFGGRVCISVDSEGCLDCFDVLDREEAAFDLENPEARKDREELYGVNEKELQNSGPSVVSLNGIIASIAVTEFLAWITGLRSPKKLLTYMGKLGIVTFTPNRTNPDCYFCYELRGKKDNFDLDQFI